MATIYSYLLQENGDYLLQENGDRIIIDAVTVAAGVENPVLKLLYGNDKRNPVRSLDLAQVSTSGCISLREEGLSAGPGGINTLYSGPSIRFDGELRRASSRGNAAFDITYDIWGGSAIELGFLQRKVLRFAEECRLYEERQQTQAVWLEYRWHDGIPDVGAPFHGQLSHYFRVLQINTPGWPQSLHTGALTAGLIENVVISLVTRPYSEGVRQRVMICTSGLPDIDSDVDLYTTFNDGEMSGTFTVMGWTRHRAADYVLFEYTNAAQTTWLKLWVDSGTLKAESNSGVIASGSVTGVSADDPIHLALVNESGVGLRIYANGALIDTGSAFTSFDDGVFFLGSTGAGIQTAYTNDLDACRAWSEALTTTQINTIYTNESPIKSDSIDNLIGPPTYAKARLQTGNNSVGIDAIDEAGADNWGVIGNVNGDVPPLYEILLTDSGEASVPEFWLGVKATDYTFTPTAFNYFEFGGTADASSSGDAYRQTTSTGVTSHEVSMSGLSGSNLNAVIFGRYNLLGRMYLSTGDVATLAAKVNLGSTADEWTTFRNDITLAGANQFELVSLGDVFLHYEGENNRLIDDISVGFDATINTAHTFRVDFLQLLPYPYLKIENPFLEALNSSVKVLLINEQAYIYDVTNSRVVAPANMSGKFELIPNKYNYFFLLRAYNGGQFITSAISHLTFFVTPRWTLAGGPVA